MAWAALHAEVVAEFAAYSGIDRLDAAIERCRAQKLASLREWTREHYANPIARARRRANGRASARRRRATWTEAKIEAVRSQVRASNSVPANPFSAATHGAAPSSCRCERACCTAATSARCALPMLELVSGRARHAKPTTARRTKRPSQAIHASR